ncbi:unnamed protein product [Commensalibacter communis]|nr:hypothetical protein [Commensalibacter communis]CAI3941707.1 unnamed protein product [Commensalibacter communis]CAI3944918.1 unnamed protein product [Commensalibacter communis]
MARRTIDIKIEEAGRDQGKLFKITEMSAFDTEAWASRSINAILRNASEHEKMRLLPLVFSYFKQMNSEPDFETLQDEIKTGEAAHFKSTESLAVYLSSEFFQLPYDELIIATKPLLNCCGIYLNPGQNQMIDPVSTNPTQYVEEASTYYTLYREAFKLHTDFFTKKIMQSLASLGRQSPLN